MEITNYCKIDLKLTGWKAKLHDLICKMENLPAGEKQRIHEELSALHIVMAEVDEKIAKLKTDFPAQWNQEKEKLVSQVAKLGEKYASAANQLFDFDLDG